jgi:signal transduction histidine kinase
MLQINWQDVANILTLCVPYLIALGVILLIGILVMIACGKMDRPARYLVRRESLLAMLLAYNSHAIELQEHRFYALQDDAIQKERSLEEKNRTLLEKQDYQIQLATLTERGRLAREIHDNVGHLLTRALFQVSALEVMQPENKEALGMVKTTLEDAMTNIRASVHDLHDEALDLRLELQKLIDQFPACPVTLRYTCQPVPPPIHYCFIAVVKEALSNIARHSNATSATVSVLEHPALYQLIIEDNGTPEGKASNNSKPGIGLHNIQERVTALQGNMIIQTDRGFRIFISISKNEQEVSQ